MKLCLTALALLATLLLAEASPAPPGGDVVYDCYDFPNPVDPTIRVKVPCPPQDMSQHARRDSQMNNNNASITNYFMVDLSCTADAKLCSSVQSAFESAGKILSGVIKFKAQVVVNASFASFCLTQGECQTNNYITLGGSYPARLLPVEDSDGLRRLYPQALVKQLDPSSPPQYGQYDINSMFNSDAPFWFRESGTGIGSNQADFLFVILHEFVHGLGFTSSWNDYTTASSAKALTPSIITYTKSSALSPTSSTVFGGFQEYIFDRFMTTTSDNKATSDVTRALNQFGITNSSPNSGNGLDTGGPTFASEYTFYSAFASSPQYSLAQSMLSMAITPNSLAFVPVDSSSLLLETTIKPFASGSSVSHVDYKRYTGTADFLMRYLADRGVTLEKAISQGKGGPIGPGLIKVLSSMGYTIQPGVDGSGPAVGMPPSPTATKINSPTAATTPSNSNGGLCFFFACTSAASDTKKWGPWGVGTVVGSLMLLNL